jgi:hypothetical protein
MLKVLIQVMQTRDEQALYKYTQDEIQFLRQHLNFLGVKHPQYVEARASLNLKQSMIKLMRLSVIFRWASFGCAAMGFALFLYILGELL